MRAAVDAVEAVEALGGLALGPQLSAALAAIDPARVPNNHLLALLQAQSRQAAHEAARTLAVIAEIGRATYTFDDTAVDRSDHPVRYAADEIRAALAWSRRAADAETDLAEQLVHDLPEVFTAFLSGHIDRPKVRVFADHLLGLTATQIAAMCTQVVPVAGRLTPGQLAVRLRRLIASIDPRHYERRYRKSLRDRSVCAWLDDTGTAVLSARGLSPAQAQAAVERIDALAHEARRAGHRSTLDQIRVDVLAGLLDGTLHHLRRDQIIAHLLAHRSTNDDAPAGDPAAEDPASEDSATENGVGDRGRVEEPSVEEPVAEDGAGSREAEWSMTDEAGAGEAGAAEDGAAEDGAAEDHRVGVEVRVALSTLIGHDEHPGEIAGLGPVPAAHAREVVAHQRRAQWRYAITDADGRLLFDGITRRRPAGLVTNGPPGGIVELHISIADLSRLAGYQWAARATTAGWSAVVADIARQYANRDRPDGDHSSRGHPDRGHPDRDHPSRGQPSRGHPSLSDLDAHPDERLPRAALRRHTQIRDRACVGIGCRHRASRCDQDHTVPYRNGGRTIAADLAPLCRHDHTLKEQPGWTLEQPAPGSFVWTTPLRGRYLVQPEPVLPPLPGPCPAPDDPGHDDPAPGAPETVEIWRPDPSPPPPADPPPADLDEPPPF